MSSLPAVLVTYRKDGSAFVSPVWYRGSDGAFEVAIAEGDVKLRHLAASRARVLAVPPRARHAARLGPRADP